MTCTRDSEHEQAAIWNGAAGHAWVDTQELLDRLFSPIEALLADAVGAAGAAHVLDVGCGTGATTRAIARRLGATGRCCGIDLSAPMLEAARAAAEREGLAATFVRGDAQSHAFEPGFDAIVSRFGVMFFDDPVVAFANLRRAATDDAALRFVAWRSATDNPFMTTAERAAAPLLPNLPPRKEDGSGQFGLADPQRVNEILSASGWADIDVQPFDFECVLQESELMLYLTRLGPLGRILPEVDEPTRVRVVDAVRAAFEPYLHGTEVRFVAACWDVGARDSGAGRR